MPPASAYINKIRADTEGRNTKIEYPGNVAQNNNPYGALMCSNFKNQQTGLYNPPWWVPTNYTIPCKCAPSIIAPIKPPPITYTYNTTYDASFNQNGYCSILTTYDPDSMFLNINDNDGVNQSTFITSLVGQKILIKINTQNIIEYNISFVDLLFTFTYQLHCNKTSTYDNTNSLQTGDIITIYKE